MWKEQSKTLTFSSSQRPLTGNEPSPAEIESIEPKSIGEDSGFEKGDKILSINGIKPRDIIDYQFLISEESLEIEVISKDDTFHCLNIEKDSDQSLGLSFTEALFDGLKQCNNNCSFCFIDQQPGGHRKSLYLKDDDYRLSFLYGSYLTLTNLNQDDWERIESQRLSPLFVSIHATEPLLRERLLQNKKAGKIMEQLHWLSKRKLQIHAQIVVCPGLNDNQQLEKTLIDLASYGKGDWPVVLSTAVVPVGLTRFRPSHDGLIPVRTKCALKVISDVEKLQKRFQKELGSNFAWLSDEWYLIAGKELPPRNTYEDLPQQENGVGSIRAFLEEMNHATKELPKKINQPKSCTWVVGKLVEKALQPICNRFNNVNGLSLQLIGLESPYWGQEQVVTGLLTGQDLLQGLTNIDLGDQLVLPSVMLKQDKPIFLDDMELGELRQALDVPIKIVHGADDIVSAVLGELGEIH